MERAQNGVNGNLPQQSFGYSQPQFISNQMPRGNPQSMLEYNNIQILQNQFVPQGYSNMPHTVANSIRPMSPITQGQFIYQCPTNYNILPQQYNQYAAYQPNFQQQFSFQQDLPVQSKPVNNPQVRKFSPLIVVDPSSNTDVDLTKYHNTSEKPVVTNLLQISDPIIEKKVLNDTIQKDKLCKVDIDKEDLCKPDNNNIKSINLENKRNVSKMIEIDDTEISLSSVDKYEKCTNDVNKNILLIKEINTCTSTHISISKEEIDDTLTKPSENIEINKNVVKEETEILDLGISGSSLRDESYISKVNEISDNEEENVTMSSEEETHLTVSILPKYHLAINKKESDETVLKQKLIYDREYLIKFKDSGKSRQYPLNMPLTSIFSEDIISATPRIISCTLPDASSNQGNVEKSGNKKQTLGGRQQFSTNYKKFNRTSERKLINLEIGDNQVFVRSKSGYVPPQCRDKQKPIDSHIELKRSIKGILNKITPQNFSECLDEIKKLNIENKEEMSCLINEIFIKAVKEEAYSVTYAQFCNKLAVVFVENQPFKSQLLKKCQDMFETPLQDQLCTVKNDWQLKISVETDIKMKTLYESDLEEQMKKAKDKYFGNIRFIGELFLHHLLAAKVILNCIIELLNGSEDSDAMLALCKLLETCGKQIDTKHKEQMNKFIIKIHDLSQSTELEKRIRFKLRDIIDMRERDWILRHVQQEKKINPKTLQEQKDEAQAEATAAANKLAAMTKKRNVSNIANNNARRNVSNTTPRQLSIKKLSCNTHTLDEKTILGPAGGSWIVGSGSRPKPHELDGWTPVGSQKPKSSAVRYTSNSRSREPSPQVIIANKYRTLESSAEASGADSRSSTPPLIIPINKAFRLRINESELAMSDEDRSDIIFSELLLTGHFNVNSWVQLRQVPPVIEKWIDDMMEKDVSCRRCIGDSFNALLIDNKMTTEQIIEGTQAFVSSIDDLICDIPKLWEFFSQFLERFIHDKNSNISFFEHIFKSMLPNNNVADCLSMAVHEASSRLGHNIVGQVFYRSIKWNTIVNENLDEFIKRNHLEFTRDGGASLSPSGGEPLPFIAEELDDMLSNNSSNENIFDFLEKHLDKPTWKKSECTSTITSSVLKAIKKLPESSVREYLKNKIEIIKRVSNHKIENEIAILHSVLDIASELNKDTLILIYDLIITEGIVSDSALQSYLSDQSLKSENNFKLTYPIISQLYIVDDHR